MGSKSTDDLVYKAGFDPTPPYEEIEIKMANIYNENEANTQIQANPPGTLKEKLLIFKDLIVLSFAFLLLFTAFQALQMLASSLNSDKGIGVKSLSIIYAIMIIGNLFYAPFIVIRFGSKYTLAVCILMYCAYILANFYAPYYYITLIIGAIILGSAGSPLWTAQSTYTNIIGMKYAKLTNQEPRTVIPRFFGIFGLIFQSAQIWGNVISHEVLKEDTNNNNNDTDSQDLSSCGYYFKAQESNSSNNTNLDRPPDSKVYLLCGIYLACGVAASLIILIFLQNRKNENKQSSKLSFNMLFKTLNLAIKDHRQTLLIVITIYTGLESAFISSVFNEAYVACAWSMANIGIVMCTFGVFNCVGSIFFGAITKWVGRVPIVTLAAVSNIGILIGLIYWRPDPKQSSLFFIIASIWGAADAVWQSQMSALYGNIFCDNQEAGFSNKGVWESIGFMMAFAYSSFLDVPVKIFILFGFLAFGMPMYYLAEVLDWRQRRELSTNM